MDQTSLFTLPNGLRAVCIERPGARSVVVQLAYRVGSVDEIDEDAGVSHFLEHMLFKGTPRRPTSKHFFGPMDALGAILNASTGHEHTAFHVSLRADRLDAAADMLTDAVGRSLLREEDLQQERNVIIEEAQQYLDDAESLNGYFLYGRLFPDHALGRPIIGFKKTIAAINRDQLVRFKNRHYMPQNGLVIVAGGLNRAHARHVIEHRFGRLPASDLTPVKRSPPPPLAGGPQVFCLPRQEMEQTSLMLGFRVGMAEDPRRPAMRTLVNLLGGTASSRLMQSLREKHQLTYSVDMGLQQHQDGGFAVISTNVAKGRAKKALTLVIDELRRIKDDGVTRKEVRDSVENLRGFAALQFEDHYAVAQATTAEHLLSRVPVSIDDRLAALGTVTPAQVRSAAREIFTAANARLTAVGVPLDEATALQQLERLGG